MNLVEALDSAFTEIPAPSRGVSHPRLHPGVIAREHKDPHGSYMVAMGTHKRSKIMYLTMQQWQALQLLNGKRSYEQVATMMRSRGVGAKPEVVEKLVEDLDKWGFFYKTPQEESITLMEKLSEHRRERRKGMSDLYKIEVVSLDPDKFFEKLLKYVSWAYTPWFTAVTIAGFIFMAYIWLSNWGQFWGDSVAYWNFTEKSWLDLLQFYFIFGIISFIHECGHALTAKHFGAEVHRLGFMLIYTSPAAFVDAGQVWLYHGRRQRCITIMAGLWVEMMLCVVATVIWWGTPAGRTVHDLAYKVVLVGGILPLIINLNPLMRLDGYLFTSEWLRTPALKERSVGFVSAWFKRHVLRMSFSVPVYPRRRQILYAVYGVLSSLYSYFVLLFLARITYRIALHFTPDWAFLLATLVALRIFKSRIIKFRNFLHVLYLDKKELMQKNRRQLIAAAAAVVILALLPLWHESTQADFLLEPMQRAVVRAQVAGEVKQVLVKEGDRVAAGAPLASLRDVRLDSAAAQASANLNVANARLVQAQLTYADYGSAEAEQHAAALRARVLNEERKLMAVSAPISGVVVTPRLQDLKGSYLAAGSLLAEVDDVSAMRARVYVPQAEVRVLNWVSSVSLQVPGFVSPFHGQVVSISPSEQEIAAGLEAATKIKGFAPGPHYVVTIVIPQDGQLTPGMTGTAKIYGRRRSLAGLALQPILDFAGRKFW